MPASRTRRILAYAYGVLAYLLALATIGYAVGFLANVGVPRSVDVGPTAPAAEAAVVDLALLGLFGLQHSVMARPWFKRRWKHLVPDPVERSTYVVLASGALAVLMWGWRPLPEVVWSVGGVLEPLLWAAYLGGWALMFAAVRMIDGDDLMGLRQVRAYREGRDLEPLDFQTPALYRYVRHPLVTGFLVAFWVTPTMSVGHLLFAGGMTAYALVGVRLEERDLVAAFGDRYRRYRAAVPMFLPRPGRSFAAPPDVPAGDDVDGGR